MPTKEAPQPQNQRTYGEPLPPFEASGPSPYIETLLAIDRIDGEFGLLDVYNLAFRNLWPAYKQRTLAAGESIEDALDQYERMVDAYKAFEDTRGSAEFRNAFLECRRFLAMLEPRRPKPYAVDPKSD